MRHEAQQSCSTLAVTADRVNSGWDRNVVALEAAAWGITVNAIAPGPTRTAMIEAMDEEKREALRSRIPLGRFATPEDIAHAVCFLAGEEASFITGATLDVNGGLLMR